MNYSDILHSECSERKISYMYLYRMRILIDGTSRIGTTLKTGNPKIISTHMSVLCMHLLHLATTIQEDLLRAGRTLVTV